MLNRSDRIWLSSHLFYEGSLDIFLVKAVLPVVDNLFREGLASQFFFIRYWEGGQHIRLRVKGEAEKFISDIKPQIEAHFGKYYEEHPSSRSKLIQLSENSKQRHFFPNNSVQFIEYQPEIKRYGGIKGVDIAENQFEASSKVVLALMKDNDKWCYERAVGTAVQLHLLFVRALGMNKETACLFFTHNHENTLHAEGFYSPHVDIKDNNMRKITIVDAITRKYQREKDKLLSYHQNFWRPLVEGKMTNNDSMNIWMARMKRVDQELRAAYENNLLATPQEKYSSAPSECCRNNTGLWPIYDNYVHMMNNRLGIRSLDEVYLSYLLKESLAHL